MLLCKFTFYQFPVKQLVVITGALIIEACVKI